VAVLVFTTGAMHPRDTTRVAQRAGRMTPIAASPLRAQTTGDTDDQ
jgi:hypothetical protein